MDRKKVPSQPEAIWKEKDMSSGRTVDAMVIILRTNGCSWARKGGCTMCGYASASMSGITAGDLMGQLDHAVKIYRNEPFVKIYTSGSFLDENEIPADMRKAILDIFRDAERILFESRPEYINEDVLRTLPKNVSIALGIESSDHDVLAKSIKKGFTPEDSRNAGIMIRKAGLKVRAYLLLKPLYLSERDAIEDAISSIMFADEFSDEISINPVNVQKFTPIERVWKKGDYRPPWIWSLIEAMRRCAGKVNARLMSSPSGGGTQRGVHNCGGCDRKALDAVERFSFSQNIKDLDTDACRCRDTWLEVMRSEVLLGTSSDVQRAIDNDLAIGK
ncbi:MAG: archaeosine biosynthesis radical SAM protein RaSEA [Methanomassiliicoccaceae archaeon]|jgi:radical SAM enzyme (TIGR01210 family)|nr:archaeosine biosynthesis radical SAM protein RaSEA [Methanomassiliicoccaceae archaeon]